MYSLAIVDDEPAIRRGLTRHIDWASMGFEVAESFEDGEDAISYLAHHHVDVIISDVRMSVVSGLTLAETIHEQGLPTEVVLLSGYKDFEYARSAMRSGVHCYLLKPTTEDELREVFAELRVKLASGRTAGSTASVRRLVNENRRRLLMRLIDGLFEDVDELAEEWRRCVLPPLTEDVSVSYALMRFAGYEDVANGPESWAALFRAHAHRLCIDDSGLRTIALVEPPDLLHFLAVAGRETGGATDAAATCREIAGARIAGAAQAFSGVVHSCTIAGADELFVLSGRYRSENLRPAPRRPEDVIAELIDASSPDADAALRRLKLELVGSGGRVRPVRRAAMDLVSGVLAVCRRRAPNRALATAVDYEALFRCTTVDEAGSWAVAALRRIVDVFHDASGGSRSRVVEWVRTYVDAHLAEDVSLERVAREVYLSPAYLSRLFREEAGQTFLDAVTEARVDRASALLADRPEYSIADVARAVGYGDPRYFARVFKARVGRTPSVYRRHLALS
jgi:two-component system, response regulator YesN